MYCFTTVQFPPKKGTPCGKSGGGSTLLARDRKVVVVSRTYRKSLLRCIMSPHLPLRHSYDDTDTHATITHFTSGALANACWDRTVPCEQRKHTDEYMTLSNPTAILIPKRRRPGTAAHKAQHAGCQRTRPQSASRSIATLQQN